MDKATEWINQNLELIDLVGKTELVRLAFAQGEVEGLKIANATLSRALDAVPEQAE